jgi:valyl-tRNA synthetase
MFNDDGVINENGGIFQNQRRYECRKNILVELEKLKLLRGKRDNPMVLSICSKYSFF